MKSDFLPGKGAGGTGMRAGRIYGWRFAVALGLACGGGHSGPGSQSSNDFTSVPPPPGGVAQFSVLPVQPVPGLSLTALGSLNPPGHTTPTDHVYFYSWDLSVRGSQPQPGTRNVYMPTTAAAFFVLQQSGTEYKIMYRATKDFYFYFDHLVPSPVPKIGDVIQAGALVGTTSPGSTLDLGAFDAGVTHDGFLTPARYAYQTLHVVSPWKYFTPALQAQLYPQVYRAPGAPDKDGKIDYGIAGRLVGDWFLQGFPIESSFGPDGWTRTLAFVYDYYDPSLVRIAIGGTVGPAGVWAIDPAAPRPETVTTASGAVAYRLYSPFDPLPPQGLLLVQMLGDAQIKVELWMGSVPSSPQFDANAFVFVR